SVHLPMAEPHGAGQSGRHRPLGSSGKMTSIRQGLLTVSLIRASTLGPLSQRASASTVAGSDAARASLASTNDQSAASRKWQFATTGYVWFASAKGETDVIGPVEPVGLDLSFGDVLKAFKFAFMGAAEARHDRIFVLGDLT